MEQDSQSGFMNERFEAALGMARPEGVARGSVASAVSSRSEGQHR